MSAPLWVFTYSGVPPEAAFDSTRGLGTPIGINVSTNTAYYVKPGVGVTAFSSGGGGSGTVTSFSFNNANGFTGSVSNASTTPQLTLTLDNNAVTYAKMQDVTAASKLLGRGTSGSGDPQEISLGPGLAMAGTTLNTVGGFSGGIFFFGDGIDGNVTLDGTNTFTWASKSGNTYTLIDTVMAHDMTINAGVTLIPAGFPIYISGTLTNNGHINGDGTGAVVGHGGGNQSGGNGAWSAGAQVYGTGTNGAGSTGGAGSAGTTNSNAIGGQGGAGGSGAGGLGGNGGTRSAPAASVGGTKHARALLAYISGRNFTGSSAQVIHGGSGGGSGAGDLANGVAGGAGGGAGGVVGLFASIITGSGSITAKGGVGGSCGAGGNTGGGGGGGGGVLYIITTTQNLASVHTLSATGGTGGAKTGTGVAGSNGSDGLVLVTVVAA